MKSVAVLVCILGVLLPVASAFALGEREVEPDVVTVDRDAWRGTGAFELIATPAAYEELTGESFPAFSEAPMLERLVEAGELRPVSERLPREPLVVQPTDRIGIYGGVLRDTHLGDDADLEDALLDQMLTYDARLEDLRPHMFKDWEVRDGGHVVRVYMREGMKWSDGHPFTADDMVFYSEGYAHNAELNPAGIRDMRIAGEMGHFRKVDDYIFDIVYDHAPNPSMIERLAWGWEPFMPMHYMKQFHPDYTPRAEVDALVQAEGVSSWLDLFEDKLEPFENPDLPTLFAWTLERGTMDDEVQWFVRNPYYWKVDIAGNQLPYIDRVARYNIGDSVEAQVLHALAGEMDFADGQELGGVANYALLRQRERDGNYEIVPMVERAPQGYHAIFFNMNHQDPEFREIFRERSFRLAFSKAIDNPGINDLFMEGQYNLRQGFAPPAGPPYYGERDIFAQGMEFDAAGANRMLDDLGLRWNSDRTVRLTPGGQELRFSYIIRARDPNYVPIAEIIKENLEEIGIHITIRPLGGSAWNELVETAQHDIAADQWAFGGRNYPLIPVFRDLAPRDDGWKGEVRWGLWAITDGEMGDEPPPAMAEAFRELMRMQAEALAQPTRQGRQAIEKEMFEWHAEHLLWLNAIQRPAAHLPSDWYYFHNRLKNVTRPAPRENYYGQPAQWYIDETE